MADPSGVSRPPVTESAFRDVRWRGRDVVIALAPLAGLRFVAEFVALDRLAGFARGAALAVAVLGILWMLAFPLWVARRRLGRLPPFPGVRSLVIEGAWAVLLLGVLWVTLIVGYTVWERVFGPPGETPNPVDRLIRNPDPFALVLFAVLAVVVGPLAEEVLFRGMVYNALRRWLSVWVALPLQAVAFGFLHLYGLAYAVILTFVGAAFALAYEWRRTILTPVLMHTLHNLMVVAYVVVFAFMVRPPVLGVNGEPAGGGCRVTHVWPGSAAADAGLRPGDVITAVDDRPVGNIQDVRAAIFWKRPGDTVLIDFIRDGEPAWVEATLKRPE